MVMHFNGEHANALQRRRRKLFIIVLAQYAVLFLAGPASAAAIYLLVGSSNALITAGCVTSLLAAALSLVYLVMHQCGAWRYSQGGIKLPTKKTNVLLAWSRIVNMISVPIWTAASILGLFVVLSTPFCGGDWKDDAGWRKGSVTDCNIQKANIGVALAASVFSIALFCTLATVEPPFAASLAGVHFQDGRDEDMLHLSAADWPSPPRATAPRSSYDTSIYAPSFQTSTPRQEEWLPKLSFDTPTDRNHPVRRISPIEIQPLRHKESDLLPSPAVLRYSQGSNTLHSMRSRPALKRSNTGTSSIYSQTTTADSTFLRRTSSVSSLSDDLSFFSPLKSPPPLARTFSCSPAVPSIPEQYLTDPSIHDQCTQELPLQSGTRPRMPSAQFWYYEQDGKPVTQALTEEDTLFPTPQKHVRRHTEVSALSPHSEDTVIKSNLNRSNTATVGGRVGKWTYENFRKGKSTDAGPQDPWTLPPALVVGEVEAASPSLGKCGRSRAERRRSRTLVKKRQPSDIAARRESSNLCTL